MKRNLFVYVNYSTQTFKFKGTYIVLKSIMSSTITSADLKNVVTYGKYYFPAGLHYFRTCSVTCDRCKRTNLPACIGYTHYDLCMQCVDKVTKNIELPIDENDNDNDIPVTRMISDRFNKNKDGDGPLTLMGSDKFST